jgi:hypothetical protein
MARAELIVIVRLPWWRRWPVVALIALSVVSKALAERILGGGIEVER